MGMIFAASPVIVLGMTMLISHIADALASGQLSARDHLEGCLAAIDSEDGRRAFVTVHAEGARHNADQTCLLYTSPSPRDLSTSRMPSSA